MKLYFRVLLLILFFNTLLNAYSIEDNFSKEIGLYPKKQYFSTKKNLTLKEIKNYFKNGEKSNKIDLIRDKTSYLWCYYEIENNSSKNINLILKHQFVVTDYVDFYIQKDNQIKHFSAGEYIKSTQRSIYDRFHLAKVSIKSNEIVKVWINYKTQGSLNNLIDIYSEKEYKKFSANENLFFGFFAGVIIAMIIYNLFLFFSFLEKIYFLYIIHLFLAFSYQILFSGYGAFYEIVLPTNLDILSRLIGNLSMVSSILFSIYFLNLKVILPKLNFLLKSILTILVIIFILTIIFDKVVYFLSDIGGSIINIIIIILIIISAILAIKKGSNEARFFLLAWVVLAIASPLFILSLGGINILPLSPDKILQIAFIFEALMFSFALADRINRLKREKQKSENIILQKTKLADMGVMLSSISHQWRQPLAQISSILMRLQLQKRYGKFSDEEFNNSVEDITNILKYMSMTIDDFRIYIKTDKVKEDFSVKNTLESVLKISDSAIKSLNIKINLEIKSKENIYGNKSELMQVFLAILTNAKNIFEEREVKNSKIDIKVNSSDKYITILFCDNGGGIKEDILPKIFEDFYTTREKSGGSGLGLYIAKDIINNNFNGKIKAYNNIDGACFEISIPIYKK